MSETIDWVHPDGTREPMTVTHPKVQAYRAIEAAIRRMARGAYIAANRLPNGRYQKRHVPYAMPAEADVLHEALQALATDRLSPDAAMALLHQPDILKARLANS